MRNLAIVIISLLTSLLARSQQELPLWPTPAPHSIARPELREEVYYKEPGGPRRVRGVVEPTLTIYRPAEGATLRTAILVCPGGGYDHLALDPEGHFVAQELARRGYTAAVLKYRMPDDRTSSQRETAPLDDAVQAIHIIRSECELLDVSPDQVGVLGFSAGGHLAGCVATLTGEVTFAVLIYPVAGLHSGLTHAGTRQHLIEGRPDEAALERRLTPYDNVGEHTPPMFLLHAADDVVAPPQATLLLAQALLDHHRPVELHLVPKGGHGFGLDNGGHNEGWIDLADRWIRNQALPK